MGLGCFLAAGTGGRQPWTPQHTSASPRGPSWKVKPDSPAKETAGAATQCKRQPGEFKLLCLISKHKVSEKEQK